MPQFIKFLFALSIRLIVVFSAIALVVFLLWGVLYLIFLKDDKTTPHKDTNITISKDYKSN